MTSRYVVGDVEDLPPGTSQLLPLGRFGIGVFNCGGTFYALLNYCPHAGAPVCRGNVVGTTRWDGRGYEQVLERDAQILRCPWHGWEFEIASGETLTTPRKRIKQYPVRVEDGKVVVELGTSDA